MSSEHYGSTYEFQFLSILEEYSFERYMFSNYISEDIIILFYNDTTCEKCIKIFSPSGTQDFY